MINSKNSMLPMRSVFINVKKSMSELGCWLAAKHATYVIYERGTTLSQRLYTFYIRFTYVQLTFVKRFQTTPKFPIT